MCRQKIICYAACGHEEYEGEPTHCPDFEKFLNSLSWNFKVRNHKGLKHCVKIVYDRVTNPSPCNACNAHAFRQQRASAPGPQKKGNNQHSVADAGLNTDLSQGHAPRSRDPDQQPQPTTEAPDPFGSYRYRPEEQIVFPLQESPLGRRGAIRRTPLTENHRRISRDSHPDSPSYLTIPSHPVDRDSTPNPALSRRGAIRRTSTQESYRRSGRNSQQNSPSYFTERPCPDSASTRPLKQSEQGRATHGLPTDEQRRRYHEAIGKGAVVPRPQQGVEPALNTPIKNERGNGRSGILLTPDRRSTGSKHVKWADELQRYIDSPSPRQEWAQQLLTPPMATSEAKPMLPEPLRADKTSLKPEERPSSRRRSRFLEDIDCVDLGY